MKVKELNRKQLEELKQDYYSEINNNVSYGEFADINELVSDEIIFKKYEKTEFEEDDFNNINIKSEIKDVLYKVRVEFENEIDTYESKIKENLSEKDINLMFEFLDHYINKVYIMLDDLDNKILIA